MNEEEKDLINLKIAISPEKYIRELLQENQQLKEDYNKVVHESTEFESKVYRLEDVIDKAIEFIEKDYYSMNTVDLDSIGITWNKLLQVREILKGENNENNS